jgi:hypothetical protein
MIYYGKTLSSSGPKLTAVHPELNKKLDLARKDYELQNRDNESKPWFPQ